jgi:hypothetical protein
LWTEDSIKGRRKETRNQRGEKDKESFEEGRKRWVRKNNATVQAVPFLTCL